jgi:hypothetical protein
MRLESGPTIFLVTADPWTRGDDWRRVPEPRPDQAYPSDGRPDLGDGRPNPGTRQAYPGDGRTRPGNGQAHPGARPPYPGDRQPYPGDGQAYPDRGHASPGHAAHRRHPYNQGLGFGRESGDSCSPRRSRQNRRLAASIALLLGLTGFVVSAIGLTIQLLPRHFSAEQQRQITSWEISRRWQSMPAGQIFPTTISYQLPATVLQDTTPLGLSALRVSIAPQETDCAKAVTSAAAGALLHRDGCQAVLRATYIDATHSYVMTVGVAVMPNDAAATSAGSGIDKPKLAAARSGAGTGQVAAGVGVVSFGGAAGKLYDYSRQISVSFTDGPYVIMYAAGYADNRPQVAVSQDPYARDEMSYMAAGVAQSVADRLASKPAAPHCPGTPGC